ncbi:longitudinals lacking protein isoform X2 [Drosophila novamexicana]|uniref:longitudinals lacking protein isoform X2 n=1 Tax=Drosophila novamexicana TaxID=47314 RepID=UPI0011E5F9AB|nr:longitudinals lacking protein isoform X2 [Drosophila novamexicana]
MLSSTDLSRKENTAPSATAGEIQRGLQRSILNVKREEQKLQLPGSRRKRLSVSEVSDMLFEFYKTKSAKAPKQQQPQQLQQDPVELSKYGQVSPTSAETLEPSSIAAIAVYGAASETASKNLMADEMQQLSAAAGAGSFHPRLKYSLKTAAGANAVPAELSLVPGVTAIPTSVLVANAAAAAAAPAHKPPAAAIAEALMRNGLHSFQQQLRAQEILRQQTPQRRLPDEPDNNIGGNDVTPTKILENLLRKQQQRDMRHSECENEPGSSTEDEEDARFNAFEDIQLMDQSGTVAGGGTGAGLPPAGVHTERLRGQQQQLQHHQPQWHWTGRGARLRVPSLWQKVSLEVYAASSRECRVWRQGAGPSVPLLSLQVQATR